VIGISTQRNCLVPQKGVEDFHLLGCEFLKCYMGIVVSENSVASIFMLVTLELRWSSCG